MRPRLVILLFIGLQFIVVNVIAQYQVNGNAVQTSCNCYQLTPAQDGQAGSVWNVNLINLNSPFNFSFDVFLGCSDGGADGMAFVLQPLSINAGSLGGGIGYAGIAPSLAVEMDTYQNNTDPSYDHIALQTNGSVTHGTGNTLAGPIQTSATAGNEEDCAWHLLQVSWDPATQIFTVSFDGVLRLSYSGNITSAFGGNPQVYWGFTAATGGANNQHQFCNTLNPSFNITPAPQCEGNPIQFNSTSVVSTGQITGFVWDFGDGNTGTGTNPSHTYATPGNYTAVLSITSEGCTETFSTPVSVNPKPTVDAGGDVPICLGDVVHLTPNNIQPTYNYSWFPTTGVSAPNTPDPFITTANTASYLLTATDANGCQASDDVTIIVNPNPVAIAGVGQTICEGESADLNGWGAPTLLWSPATGLSDPTIGTPTASPTTTTVYTLLVTDANGCQDSDAITITVNPVPTVNAGTDATMCVGEPHQMTGSGALDYAWSPATGLSNPTIADPIFDGLVSASYTLTGTDANGCSNTAFVMMNVNPLPNVNAGADVGICIGDVQQLNATGAVDYVWTSAANIDNATIASPIFSGVATETLSVTGTDANGCVNDDEVIITVNPLPIVSAGNDAEMCIGSTLTLGASGAVSYTWSPATDLNNPNIASPVYSGAVDVTLTVTGTDANGCVNTDQMSITVNPLPVVDAGTDAVICAQTTTQLAASGALSYAWTPATDIDDATVSDPVLTGVATTTLTVTGTDANGCVDTDQVTVTVNQLPQAVIDVIADVCVGSPTFFSESSIGNGLSYQWTLGDNTTSTDPLFSHTYADADTYPVTLAVTDVNGCEGSDASSAVVADLPVVTFSVFNGPDFCEGEQISFQNTSPGTNAGLSWNFNYQPGLPTSPGSSSSLPDPLYSYQSYGSYNVRLRVLSNFGCINDATQQVFIHDVPSADFAFTIACEKSPTVFTDLSIVEGGSTINGWQWDFADGTPFEYVQNPSYTFSQDGIFDVELVVQTNDGCRDTMIHSVWINPTPVITISGTDVCIGGETQFLNSSSPQDATIVDWTWDFADGQTLTGPDAVHTYQAYGNYDVTLTASSDSGCVATGATLVRVFPNPEPQFFVVDAEGCEPHTTPIFNTSTIASGAISTYSWSFDFGTGSTEDSPTVVISDTTGTFGVTLTAVSAEGCQSTVTQLDAITVHVTPVAAFTQSATVVPINDPAVDFTDASIDAVNYDWDFGDGTSSGLSDPRVLYTEPGIYDVLLTVTNGMCSAEAGSTVVVEPIFSFYIPSAFTPDNNGKNEVFIGYGEGYTDFQMFIFNRWGEQIFYSGDDQVGWDGTLDGQQVPQGVYTYRFLLKDGYDRDKNFFGDVNLLR